MFGYFILMTAPFVFARGFNIAAVVIFVFMFISWSIIRYSIDRRNSSIILTIALGFMMGYLHTFYFGAFISGLGFGMIYMNATEHPDMACVLVRENLNFFKYASMGLCLSSYGWSLYYLVTGFLP